MALETVPWTLASASHGAELFRRTTQSMISGPGVVGVGDLAVTQNGTPNMSVNVAAGQAWMPGTLSSTSGFPTNLNAQTAYGLPSSLNQQGSYYAWNSATTNLVISAADPTNPRIDIVCASVQDAAYSGVTNQALLQVITGTPAPSPSAPNAPASSLVLAQIAVAAGVSSIVTANITDKRPFLMPSLPRHPYKASVYQSSAQSVTNASATGITFNTAQWDGLGSFNLTTGVWTCPAAGYYLVTSTVTLLGTTGILELQLYKNSVIYRSGSLVPFNSSQGVAVAPLSEVVQFAVGDAMKIVAFQNSGGAVNTSTGEANTACDVVLLTQ